MTAQTQAVLTEAMNLPPVDRAGIIEQLLASFDVDSRHAIDELWATEAESRLQAFDQGEINAVSLQSARARINSR
jgi:putative addiction module component (TIGR02574 family)